MSFIDRPQDLVSPDRQAPGVLQQASRKLGLAFSKLGALTLKPLAKRLRKLGPAAIPMPGILLWGTVTTTLWYTVEPGLQDHRILLLPLAPYAYWGLPLSLCVWFACNAGLVAALFAPSGEEDHYTRIWTRWMRYAIGVALASTPLVPLDQAYAEKFGRPVLEGRVTAYTPEQLSTVAFELRFLDSGKTLRLLPDGKLHPVPKPDDPSYAPPSRWSWQEGQLCLKTELPQTACAVVNEANGLVSAEGKPVARISGVDEAPKVPTAFEEAVAKVK